MQSMTIFAEIVINESGIDDGFKSIYATIIIKYENF